MKHVGHVIRTASMAADQEYIIKEKRVSNAPIRSVECVRKVTRLECKFMNDLFYICDSIRTEFRVYEHNQSRIQRLYAFQACVLVLYTLDGTKLQGRIEPP